MQVRLGAIGLVGLGLASCGGETRAESSAGAGSGGGSAGSTGGVSSDAAGRGSVGGSSGASSASGRGGGDVSTGGTNPSTGGTDCQTEVEEPGLCQLLIGCETATLNVWCSESDTGTWGCSCTFGTTTASYELADQSGIAACRTAAGVCGELSNAEFGEPECVALIESSTAGGCAEEATCVSRAHVAPGIDVLRTERRTAHCKGGAVEVDELAHCGCNFGVLRRFDVRGFDTLGGCGPIRSLCENGADLHDVQCEPAISEAVVDFCHLSERCGRAVAVDGAEFELIVGGEVVCGAEGDRARCVCNGPGSMDFDYVADAVTPDSCEYAGEVCWRGPVSWEDGLHTCTVAEQVGDLHACDARLDCVADARFGSEGDELRVHGTIQIDCRLDAAAASATCRCRGVESEEIEVESGDAWGACTRAAEVCPDLVGPEFNPAREF